MTGPFGGALAAAPDGDGKLFLIGPEEHFATRELQRLNAGTDKRLFSGGGRRPELLDLGAGRIAGAVVAAWPDRFRAFATLPLSQPEAAADELERSVREHGIVGCMSYGPIDGRFLDHADFAPVLARAEALGVPIYIHPNWPSPRVMEAYYDGLGNDLASRILSGPGAGTRKSRSIACV